MAKKAKIDLLDVDNNEENRASCRDETRDNRAPDDPDHEAGHDKKLAWIHAWISRLGAGRLKILLLLIVTILLVVVAGGTIWFYHGSGETTSVSAQKDARKTVLPTGEKVAVFDHIVVDVRDKKGDIRIAFCDIAAEFEHLRAAGAAGEQVNLRNVIYSVLKRKPIVDGLLPEQRELIKIELKHALNRLLGEKAVKNIYITRFEVI